MPRRSPEAAMHSRFAAALLFLFALVGYARAADVLEVIPLQHRTAEEVIPSLRPFLEPGGALTGMGSNLILRASPANRAQIKQALAALDVAPRQLRITVRQSLALAGEQKSAGLHGKLDSRAIRLAVPPGAPGGAQLALGSDNAHLGAQFDDRSLDQVSRVSQQVRVADGGSALIQASVELPLTLREVVEGPYGRTVRESLVFYSVGSGFYVVPQLVGDRVNLEIRPMQQAFAAGSSQAIAGQELHTTVGGRLGEWIPLGGGEAQDLQSHRRLLGKQQAESRDTRQVWLRVDVVE
jgi:hypothetical protein